MPQAIPAAVTWAVSAFTSAATVVNTAFVAASGALLPGASFATQVAVANAAFKATMMFSLSAASAALLRPNTPSTGTTLDFKPDPKAPVRGAMGYTALGGNKVFQAAWGYKGVALSLGAALSLGPIDAITKFEADGATVAFTGAQNEATGFYAADMWQKTTLGLPDDPALLPPTGLKYGNPPLTGWGAQHAAPGVSFAFWTMVLAKNPEDRDVFTNGVPDPRWIGRWMKVWDPRKDSTYPGGVGPQRRDDWRTWAWSECPYAHALAWARGHFKLNPDGSIDRTKRIAGIGAPDSAIDIPAFVEGMNIAEANDWTISGEWSTSDGKYQTLLAMLQAGGGEPISRGAQISVIVNAPRVSTYTYTRDDLVGRAEIRPLTPRRERKNTIVPRYKSEANGWEYVPAGEVTSQVYRDEDRGEPRSLEVEYTHVRRAKQAAQLAAYDLANLREGLTATLPSKAHLMHLHPGDCITVDVPELALAGQKFVVRRTTSNHGSATTTLELRAESDAKHPWALGQAENPAPSPALSAVDPKYMPPPEPEYWVVIPKPPKDGTAQPVLIVEGEVDTTDVASVLVEYAPAAIGPWRVAYSGVPLLEGKYEAQGLDPGADYWVSVRYVARNGAISDRLVSGPYAAPALVASDTVAVGGRPTVDVLTLIDGTKQTVEDLEAIYGDTASAAQSAADAAAASAAAVLAKADAVQAKDESITAAGASAASAAQAGGYRTDAETAAAASSAERIAAEAARQDTVVAGGDPDFLDGLTAWGPEGTADPGQYSPANTPGWAASYQGRPGVALADTGARRQFYSRKLWPVDTSRKYKVRTRLHAGATGSGLTYVGFRALDAAGANTAGNGSHQYAAVGGEALAAGWHERSSAVITGEGGINGVSQFNPGTRQIQLMAYLNYDNEAGKVAALDGIWLEDVTESEAARLSAEASVQSASTATAKATEAAASAEAAEQDRLAAQTARSGSEAARDTAVTAKEDAQGAAATAAAQQALATTAKNDAQAAASASAGSASLASSKADEAGTHAAAASAERVAAEAARGDADDAAAAAATQAATVTAKAGEAGDHAASALAQATTAATKAGEALTYAGQSSDARDDAVSARNLSQTAASNAAAAAATAQAAESTATDKAAQASASATVAANLTGATANLLKRSQLFTTADTDDWSKGNSGLPSPTFAVDTHLNQRPPGELSYFMYSDGGGVNYMETRLPYFLAEPGKRYGAAVYAVATDGDGGAFIYWQDKDGNYVSYSPAATVAYGEATLSPDLATWKRLVTFGVCPPGAVRGVVTLRKNISPGPAGVWFCRPMAFQATDTQTQAPPWAPANTSEAASQIPGLQASVSTAAAAAIDAQGKVDAKYGVTLDGNGYASGFENTNNGTVAEFNILADKFGIRDPSGSAERTEYRGGNWYVYSTGIRTRYGKAFGGTEKIVWWTGPDSIAEGSESKANAYVYISQNTVNGPRFGGSDVPAPGGGGGGSGAKQLAGASGALGATATISSVAAGSLVEIGAFFDVAALDAPDATMTGYIRFEESTDGVNWTTLTDVNVFVTSDSLVLPGPSYAATGADASCSVFGTKSGTVTYRARFVRTAGANIYGSDYSMSGTLKVTAPAA